MSVVIICINSMGHSLISLLLSSFLVVVLLLLVGQGVGLVNYDYATRLGLQEPKELIGPFGVAMNRCFCIADVLVYTPLTLAALVGMVQQRTWSLPVTAAVLGISAYWPIITTSMLLLLPGVPGYSFEPPVFYWPIMIGLSFTSLAGLFYMLRSETVVWKDMTASQSKKKPKNQ